MKKIINTALCATLMCASVSGAFAAESDVAALENKVAEKVAHIEASGILPTHDELEFIAADIVFDEIQQTGMSVKQAVEKYQLVPALERYIRIKKAATLIEPESGDGAGMEPPTSN